MTKQNLAVGDVVRLVRWSGQSEQGELTWIEKAMASLLGRDLIVEGFSKAGNAIIEDRRIPPSQLVRAMAVIIFDTPSEDLVFGPMPLAEARKQFAEYTAGGQNTYHLCQIVESKLAATPVAPSHPAAPARRKPAAARPRSPRA